MRCVSALFGMCLIAGVAAEASTSARPQKTSAERPTGGSAEQRTQAFAKNLQRVLSESLPIVAVHAMTASTLRIVVDEPLLKEPEYRAALVRSCEAILAAGQEQRLTTIEVVNREERQGYIFRGVRACGEAIRADDQGRRLAILPATTIFSRPR